MLILLVSCKEEVIQKPDQLVDKDVMVNVMVDLSILEAIKYQNPASLDTFKINPRDFFYKKYKIDSVQFAESNIYYASRYNEYKDMYDGVIKRIEEKKTVLDSLVKKEENKLEKIKADSIKRIKVTTVKKDSLPLKKLRINRKKGKDTLRIQ